MCGKLVGLETSLLVPYEKTYSVVVIVGGISKNVFEQRTSTGSGYFASLGSCFAHICVQIVHFRQKTVSKTNLALSWHTKTEKASLPVNVCRSKTSLFKLPTKFSSQVF